jgi:hypothetical protein
MMNYKNRTARADLLLRVGGSTWPDVRLDYQISDFKSQISNLKSQISNLKSQISNLRFHRGSVLSSSTSGSTARACCPAVVEV